MHLVVSLLLLWLSVEASAAAPPPALAWRLSSGSRLDSLARPLRRWSAVSPSAAAKREEPGNAVPRRPRLRPALYWSAGLALAAGGAAWWHARRADRAYDRYLHAAGPRRQEQELRQARRSDRVAGAAFGVMEIGIVLSTYLVFF